MIKLNCLHCGCEHFKVSKKGNRVKCVFCGEYYVYDQDGWFHEIKQHKIVTCFRKLKNIFLRIESSKEALERMRIKKEKKALKLDKRKVLKLNKLKEKREKLQLNWSEENKVLFEKKVIYYNKNDHKGKLRGKHIALRHYKFLKKIGLKPRIDFGDSFARIRL